MKAKTIRQVLRKKIDEWLESIDDEELRKDLHKNIIVTGGCIPSMLLNEKINDYDVYFTNKDTVIKVAKYYVTKFSPKNKKGIPCKIYVKYDEDPNGRVKIVIQSSGIASEEGTNKPYEYFEGATSDDSPDAYVGEVMDDPVSIEDTYQDTKENLDYESKPLYKPVFLSTNAITLSGHIQLVLRFYGPPDEIHKNYDFVHCTNYWICKTGELILPPEALEAIITKELRYQGSKYPIASLIRIRKFIQRGWTINAGQIVKMCFQLNELDLKNFEILEDQLTGVDVAYFAELVNKVKSSSPEKINSAYLISIIDRMF
jgi:hypothetical protein